MDSNRLQSVFKYYKPSIHQNKVK